MGDEKQTTDSNGNGNSSQAHFTLRQYFDLTKAELDAMPPESLKKIAFDITEVVMTLSGCHAKLLPFREKIIEQLPKTNVRYFDDLERYVGALHHAHRMHGILLEEDAPIAEWSNALAEQHQVLVTTADLLAQEGLINGAVLPPLRARTSNKVLTLNVLKLAEVLRQSWPKIERKTVLSMERLDAIEEDAVRLTHAIGERDQRIAAISASADTRLRAYTLTIRAYSEVRRAVGYLRWHEGDADLYAPALANHAKRRPGDPEEDPPTDAEAGAARPTATDQTSTGVVAPAPAPAPGAQGTTGPTGAPFTR